MKTTKQVVYAALLIALSVLIPITMPRIDTGIASYTLASHVPVMTAMFISPATTVVVAIGSALSYLLRGSSPVVVARALSHIVFGLVGAYLIHKDTHVLKNFKTETSFNLIIGLIHVIIECLVVTIFLFSGTPSTQDIFTLVFVAVGLGGLVHSFIDFFITAKVAKGLKLAK